MAGTPMIGIVKIARGDVAGRYTAETSLEMAGTWRLSIAWAGAAGEGTVGFSQPIQRSVDHPNRLVGRCQLGGGPTVAKGLRGDRETADKAPDDTTLGR